jgi:hypothetical protein
MAAIQKKSEPAKIIMLPEGRLINSSLFERDAFTSANGVEGKPTYKIELAFDPADVTGEGKIEDDLANFAADEWGDTFFDLFLEGKKVHSPLKDGDEMAEARAERGKDGDAYKGKIVIRANTSFNQFGQDGPGGVAVFDGEAKPIGVANQTAVYPGCFGIAAVTIAAYVDNVGKKALKFYLSAFQKTRDGEKLVQGRDHSTLFKPVGKPSGEASGATGRRKRG